MKYQLITYEKTNLAYKSFFSQINTFGEVMIFDDFDVNVIDLTNPNIWKNKNANYSKVNCNDDFRSIGSLISTSSSSKTVLLLPQNLYFKYEYSTSTKSYRKSKALKDMLEELRVTTLKDLYLVSTQFGFGVTNTTIENIEAKSDFFFSHPLPFNSVTVTESGTVTTIKDSNEKVFCTFLLLDNAEKMEAFFKATNTS